MASLIFLGNLFLRQQCVKAHPEFSGYPENVSSCWNLDEDISMDSRMCVIIAKGNIIEGVEAKT